MGRILGVWMLAPRDEGCVDCFFSRRFSGPDSPTFLPSDKDLLLSFAKSQTISSFARNRKKSHSSQIHPFLKINSVDFIAGARESIMVLVAISDTSDLTSSLSAIEFSNTIFSFLHSIKLCSPLSFACFQQLEMFVTSQIRFGRFVPSQVCPDIPSKLCTSVCFVPHRFYRCSVEEGTSSSSSVCSISTKGVKGLLSLSFRTDIDSKKLLFSPSAESIVVRNQPDSLLSLSIPIYSSPQPLIHFSLTSDAPIHSSLKVVTLSHGLVSVSITVHSSLTAVDYLTVTLNLQDIGGVDDIVFPPGKQGGSTSWDSQQVVWHVDHLFGTMTFDCQLTVKDPSSLVSRLSSEISYKGTSDISLADIDIESCSCDKTPLPFEWSSVQEMGSLVVFSAPFSSFVGEPL